MFLMNTTETILTLIFLITCMLSIGMQTTVSDLKLLVTSRSLLMRTLLANFVVVPLIGIAIVLIIPLQPHVSGALLLLACTPGGLSAIQFTSKVKGSASLAGAVLFLLSLLALFISPLMLQFALPGDVRLVVPYGRIVLFFVALMLLPLIAGMFLLARSPGAVQKLFKPVVLAGLISFVAFMIESGSLRKAAAGGMGTAAVGTMLLFILISMAAGWVLGGPTPETRQILATSTSMRNAALCLAISESSAPGHAVLIPLIAFSLLMVPPNMLFTLYLAVRGRRKDYKTA